MDYQTFFNTVSYVLTVLVPIYMIAWVKEHKKYFWLKIIISSLVAVVIVLLCNYVISLLTDVFADKIIWLHVIKFVIAFILALVNVIVCFKCGFFEALYCTTVGYCVQHISGRLDSIVREVCFNFSNYWIGWFISLAIAAAVFVIYYFLVVSKRLKDGTLYVAERWQIGIALCTISISIVYNSFGISYAYTASVTEEIAGTNYLLSDRVEIFACVMSILVSLLALILNVNLTNAKKLQSERDVLKKIINDKQIEYRMEKENIENFNIKCHDLKHWLASMKGTVYNGDIDELLDTINIYDAGIKTGNTALEVVLNQKKLYCDKNDIRFTFMIDGSALSFISEGELYALFCNAIDNAIDAVKPLPGEKRVISLTQKVEEDSFYIILENYFGGELPMDGGIPVSKKQASGHGYGVKSIRMIVEKYNGTLGVSVKDGDIFSLCLTFAKGGAPLK